MTDHIALFLAAAALLLTSSAVFTVAAWRRAQRRLVRSLFDTITRLTAAAQLVEHAVDRLADEARVASLLGDLAGAWDLDDALQRVADVAVRLTDARGAVAGVTGPADEHVIGSSGDVPAAETAFAWPFDGVQAMTFATISAGPARSTVHGAAVPVTSASSEPVGALTAFFESGDAAARSLSVLERVASTAAPVLQAALAVAAAPAHEDDARDRLTRLQTRAAFHEALLRESARARRHRSPLTVALVDVDDAPAPNARDGAGATDELLVAVADAIDAARPSDSLLYRIGAVSFGLVLPGRTPEGADAVVSALRAAQHARGGPVASAHLSSGVAELLATDDATTFAARAHAALDAAKRARLRSVDEGG